MDTSCRKTLPMIALAFGLVLGNAWAQTPPETTSKVKRVLLYEKVGGWIPVAAMAQTGHIFSRLAQAKGFQVDTLKTDEGLTPENLKRYQVIVWNNNTDGGKSVPSVLARRAVMEYLRQGGGWMLLHLASDHNNSWSDLGEVLGTTFSLHGQTDFADLVADSAAKSHPELRHVLSSLPDSSRHKSLWLSFRNTVRPLPGVTVLYNARNGHPQPILPLADGSKDHPYVWAREVERGRLLYNGIGSGAEHQGIPDAAPVDSAIFRMYWMNLRWLAGDFRNGCTEQASIRFDPEARIDDGSCSLTGLKPTVAAAPPAIRLSGRRLRFDGSLQGGIRLSLRNLHGVLVWQRSLESISGDILLDGSLEPGVYSLEAQAPGRTYHLRAAIP